MWCVLLFIRQDICFVQKNMELSSYEESFKITTAKKMWRLLTVHPYFINWLHLHFHLHLYTSVVQSYVPKVQAFLFQHPIQNFSYTSKYILSHGQKKNWGILQSIRSTFSPQASKPLWWQDTMQTACQIPPAGPAEESGLLHSPVLCHLALRVAVCKMERRLHDLVLLIKGSTLTVYLWPTPKYYRVFILRQITLLKKT